MTVSDIPRQAFRSGRTLARAPLFVACTAGTLAVGVGLSAAIFAALDTLVFKPPAGIRSPSELVTVGISNYVDYRELSAQTSTLQLAALTAQPMLLQRGADSPLRVQVQCVSGTYFSVLGVPVTGRAFDGADGGWTAPASVVLSHALWVQQFGADPAIVGRSVRLAGKAFQVTGMAPQGFRGLDGDPIDAWVPIAANPEACSFTGSNLLASARSNWLSTIGRLRPGVPIDRARAEMATLAARAERAGTTWTVEPFDASRTPGGRADARLARLLALAATALLLIACNNVALLLVSRAFERQREYVIRLHLGASRLRVLFEVIVEGVWLCLLSLAGAAIVAAAAWAVLSRVLPALSREAWLSSRSVAILAGIALVSGAVTLLAPCLQVMRAGTAPFSRIGSGTAGDRTVARRALVALQFALALVLAMAAHVFVRSLINVRSGVGYDIDEVMVASADFRAAGVRRESAQRAMLDEAADSLRQIPQISVVGLSSTGPLGTAGFRTVLPSLTTGGTELERAVNYVSPAYFAAVGTAILEGRPFNDRDVRGAPAVAIVDEGLARATWPGKDVVGSCVTDISLDRAAGCVQIVGISAGRRLQRLTTPVGEVFFPLTQGDAVPQALFIRASVPVEQALPLVLATLRSHAGLHAVTARPLSDLVDAQARIWIVGSRIFATLGSLAEMLAALGIYGTLALSVRRRTPELGIRAALGADPRRIASLVTVHAAAPMVAGWAAGLLAVFWTASLSRSYLFGVTPTDLMSVSSASIVLLLAGCAGAVVPTVRAMRLSPAEALRVGGS
jgi:predicted permease